MTCKFAAMSKALMFQLLKVSYINYLGIQAVKEKVSHIKFQTIFALCESVNQMIKFNHLSEHSICK